MAEKLAEVSVPGVPNPDPAIVTVAFAVPVGVAPPGTYCTRIVQLLPGLTTAPLEQVPPVIENVPVPVPGFVALAIVGAAVSVRAPVAAAELLTVMVPFFVVVLAGVVVSAGYAKPTVAPVTLNVTAGLNDVVPWGVTTSTPRDDSEAPLVMANVAVKPVPVPFTAILLAVIPLPAVTAEALNRSTPVMLTFTLVPRVPEVGVTAESEGPTTLKATVLVVPPGVVTLTLRTPEEAPVVMVNVAVTVVAEPTLRLL